MSSGLIAFGKADSLEDNGVLVLREDGRIFARAASGELVEVALTASDIERLKGRGCADGCGDLQQHIVRVLCEILARELPRHRPS